MFGHFPVRRAFIGTSIASVITVGALSVWHHEFLWLAVPVVPFVWLGLRDMTQKKQAIRRNFPVLGRGRYLLEMIRPEINQYFIESNTDGRPFSREERSNVYQRSKKDLNTQPFGTQHDVYEVGYEWINHSIAPVPPSKELPRHRIGEANCSQPYDASYFNVSAMSYGALSKNAIMALNLGAKEGGFFHNTGEGGLSPYHLQGGDVVWQIGTGYFGARNHDGTFSLERFTDRAHQPTVKMIEIKLSQGAKPGHGGILPKEKVTLEISKIRDIPMGQDALSPPAHTAVSTPIEMMEFIATLREASGGKPVGFKLCVGHEHEVLALCKAMMSTGITPDFITVDGGEGGTGAAPLEFTNSVGTPGNEGLVFLHNALVGTNLRDKITVIASGRITTGFQVASKLAMGADICNSARGFMFALGCIQALQCNSNTCPTGVATQDADLVEGLVVDQKSTRVANFHHATLHSFLELIGAAGLSHPRELKPWHIHRRTSPTEVKHLSDIYCYIENGALLSDDIPEGYRKAWRLADPSSFQPTLISVPY